MATNDLDMDGPAPIEARVAQLETRVRHLEIALQDALAALQGQASGEHLGDAQHWTASGYPILPRGRIVGVGSDIDPHDFLASGWWPPEDWGVWGREAQHSIRFHVPDHSHGYVSLKLTLLGFVAAERDRPHVGITANGYFLGRFHLAGRPQTLTLQIPPSAIDQGDVILNLEHNDPVSPTSIGVSEDPRPLGVGFVALLLP